MRIRPHVFIALLAILNISCLKDESGNIDKSNKVDKPVFGFTTNSSHTLNFKYDVPEGYIVGFDVYTEDPLETLSDGSIIIRKDIVPIEKGFTDKNGAYSKSINIPASATKIFIYTNYAGVSPRLLVAEINNGILDTPAPLTAKNSQKFARSGGSTDYNAIITKANQFEGMPFSTLTLGNWYTAKSGSNPTTLANGEQVKIYGRPVNLSYVNKQIFGTSEPANDALQINADVMKAINTALLGDNSGVPVDSKYLKKGDIDVTKEAELDLIFIQNWGAYRNTLAYYCYETANPPKSINDIKYQTIAIPNAMEQKMDLKLSSYYDVVSMYKGEGVKLKYIDKSGVMHDKFPAGTSVGWILYRNGYNAFIPDNGNVVMAPSKGEGANYSNPAFSVSPNTAILRHGDFVVIGFDDGDENSGYRDYLDVVFNVQSTPSGAITEEVPDVKPEDPKPVNITGRGVLLFEDLWPYQGDFDMNDVVMGYNYTVTKNSNNEITEAEVKFTVMHSGAQFNNSFAYQDKNIANATVTITGGDGASSSATIDRTNNIIRLANNVLDYANKPDKVIFTVKYKYNSPIPVSQYIYPPFNPFITIGESKDTNYGLTKEVHLTNYEPTALADKSWFTKKTADWSNPALGQYYITFENYNAKEGEDKGIQLPFAINIVYESDNAMKNFKVTQETKNIYKSYPDFKKWVNSNGKEYTDWYLNFKE